MAVIEKAAVPKRALAAPLRLGRPHLLVALVIAMAVPYGLMGPGFLLDDWRWLANREFDGSLTLMGPYQYNRPGQAAIYTFMFGILKAPPMVHYALQTALVAAVAVSILATLRRFMPGHLALVVALVWVLQPNDSSFSYFFPTSNIVIALLLVLAGVRVLADGGDRRSELVSAVAFGLGALFYEAVIPVALAAALAVPMLQRRTLSLRAVLFTGAAVTPMVLLVLVKPMYSHGSPWMQFDRVIPLHFGRGIAGPLGPLSAVAILGLAAWIIFRHLHEECGRLVVGGLAVLVVGVLPFVKFDYRVLGHGDRAVVVSGIGGAMVITGVGLFLWGHRQKLTAGLAVVAAVAVLPIHLERAANYREAVTDAVAVRLALEAWPAERGEPVLGPGLNAHGGIMGLRGDVVGSAYRLAQDDARVNATVPETAEEFWEAPEQRRLHWNDVLDQ